jgi:hypothetical protein
MMPEEIDLNGEEEMALERAEAKREAEGVTEAAPQKPKHIPEQRP